MTNYTQFGKNVIFCAPAQMLDQPIRKESRASVAILPGAVVSLNVDGDFVNGPGDYSYVADRDHLAQMPVTEAYEAQDRVTAFELVSGIRLNCRGADGAEFAEDQPVFAQPDGTVSATGADGATAIGHAAETITTSTAQPLVTIKFK